MRVWRICSGGDAAASFKGESTLQSAGRWNPAGVRMVYTSTSLALAAVELFVHLETAAPPDDLVSVSAVVPDDVSMDWIDPKALPEDWNTVEHDEVRQIGAEWIDSKRSVALRVPSEAVSGEWNILLNPAHPEFSRIAVDPSQPFVFDSRMFR